MKATKHFSIIAITAIIALAIIGCKGDDDTTTGGTQPQPVAQSITFSGITTDNGYATAYVTVNYTALPNTVPGYMSILETVIKKILPTTRANGNLTINVISSGDDGFVLAGLKTLNVRESWIANATEMEMGVPMMQISNEWIAEQ